MACRLGNVNFDVEPCWTFIRFRPMRFIRLAFAFLFSATFIVGAMAQADDLAMEFAARIGISPDQVIQGWLGFMKQMPGAMPEEYRAQYEQEYATCKTLFDANFTTKDSAGKTVAAYVAIGDLSEPHHSDCYRLFNFWRNKKLRRYTVATPAVFEPGWEALRAHAQELSDIAGSNGL